MQGKLRDCEQSGRDSADAFNRRKIAYESQIAALNDQLNYLKQNNNQMINQLKDLSVISNSQAESIKQSLQKYWRKRCIHTGPSVCHSAKGFSEHGSGNEFERSNWQYERPGYKH